MVAWIEQSNQITDSALVKETFWQNLKNKQISLNERQKKALNKMFSGFEGKAHEELIAIGVFEQEEGGCEKYLLQTEKACRDDRPHTWKESSVVIRNLAWHLSEPRVSPCQKSVRFMLVTVLFNRRAKLFD